MKLTFCMCLLVLWFVGCTRAVSEAQEYELAIRCQDHRGTHKLYRRTDGAAAECVDGYMVSVGGTD